MRRLLGILVLALLLSGATLASADARPAGSPRWLERDTPSTESLRGLSAVDGRVAWVAGDGGGVWRTTDGGRSWSDVAPPGSAALLFRDIEARDALRASVLAIGTGNASRIYRTDDGGRTWRLAFVNDDAAAFYDCMAFFAGGRRGLAVSDPVHGAFRVAATYDGGRSWRVLASAGMPRAVDGEFGFAASGTCLVTQGGRNAWIASGGAAARIYHSRDGGRTWSVSDQPIPASGAGGVFSLAFHDPHRGLAVGGDFTSETNGVDASARTRDGDAWTGGGDLGGYRSGVDWMPGRPWSAVAVGPSGSDLTADGGRSWTTFSDTGFHAVQCPAQGPCWASGSGGRVARLVTPH